MSEPENEQVAADESAEETEQDFGPGTLNPDLKRSKLSSRGIRRRAPRQAKFNETDGTPA